MTDQTQPEWAKRLEIKLDLIIEALTAEDIGEDDEPGMDLDGNRLPGERDQSQPL
jgi:hypothetical protein